MHINLVGLWVFVICSTGKSYLISNQHQWFYIYFSQYSLSSEKKLKYYIIYGYIYIFIRTDVYFHAHLYIFYIHLFIYVCAYIYIYILKYVCIYTYIYKIIEMQLPRFSFRQQQQKQQGASSSKETKSFRVRSIKRSQTH